MSVEKLMLIFRILLISVSFAGLCSFVKCKFGIENMQSVFSEHLDRHDYVLVLDKDPVFEKALNEFLENYEGDAQIMYAY